MSKKCTGIAVLVLVCLALSACIVESERPVIREHPWVNEQGNYLYGVVVAGGPGFVAGGRISALLYFQEGFIRYVRIDVSADTQSHVGTLPGVIVPIVRITNSFNFPDTIVSGATVTTQRLKNAVRNTLINEYNVRPEDVCF